MRRIEIHAPISLKKITADNSRQFWDHHGHHGRLARRINMTRTDDSFKPVFFWFVPPLYFKALLLRAWIKGKPGFKKLSHITLPAVCQPLFLFNLQNTNIVNNTADPLYQRKWQNGFGAGVILHRRDDGSQVWQSLQYGAQQVLVLLVFRLACRDVTVLFFYGYSTSLRCYFRWNQRLVRLKCGVIYLQKRCLFNWSICAKDVIENLTIRDIKRARWSELNR